MESVHLRMNAQYTMERSNARSNVKVTARIVWLHRCRCIDVFTCGDIDGDCIVVLGCDVFVNLIPVYDTETAIRFVSVQYWLR